jgi:hypothetical protein
VQPRLVAAPDEQPISDLLAVADGLKTRNISARWVHSHEALAVRASPGAAPTVASRGGMNGTKPVSSGLRQKRKFPSSFNVIWSFSPASTNISLGEYPKSVVQCSCFVPTRGVSRSSRTRSGIAVDAACCAQSLRGRAALLADGEAVWSWRPDAGAKFPERALRALGMTGAKEPGPRGERGVSR